MMLLYGQASSASCNAGVAAGLARGGQARFLGSRSVSTRGAMPKSYSPALDLVPLLDRSSAVDLISELACAATIR